MTDTNGKSAPPPDYRPMTTEEALFMLEQGSEVAVLDETIQKLKLQMELTQRNLIEAVARHQKHSANLTEFRKKLGIPPGTNDSIKKIDGRWHVILPAPQPPATPALEAPAVSPPIIS